MKKLVLACLAVLGLNLANAQHPGTVTNVKSGKGRSNVSNRPTAEVLAERSAMQLKSDLGLSEDQYKKVYDIKVATNLKKDEIALKYNANDNRDARIAELTDLKGNYTNGFKKVMTADQYTKWEAIVTERYNNWKKMATAQPNAKPDFEEQQLRITME